MNSHCHCFIGYYTPKLKELTRTHIAQSYSCALKKDRSSFTTVPNEAAGVVRSPIQLGNLRITDCFFV